MVIFIMSYLSSLDYLLYFIFFFLYYFYCSFSFCFFFYFSVCFLFFFFFFFSSRRRHTRLTCDWSSDVCSSDLIFTRRQCLTDRNVGPRFELHQLSARAVRQALRQFALSGAADRFARSEERRVGKECRSRWAP